MTTMVPVWKQERKTSFSLPPSWFDDYSTKHYLSKGKFGSWCAFINLNSFSWQWSWLWLKMPVEPVQSIKWLPVLFRRFLFNKNKNKTKAIPPSPFPFSFVFFPLELSLFLILLFSPPPLLQHSRVTICMATLAAWHFHNPGGGKEAQSVDLSLSLSFSIHRPPVIH